MPSLIISHLLVIWLGVQRLAWCAERASTRERFKVVIAPLICKRICLKGQCQDTCEQGNNTTLIGENGQSADTLTGPGFRVVQVVPFLRSRPPVRLYGPVHQPSPVCPVPAPRTSLEVRVSSLIPPEPAPRTRLPVHQPSPVRPVPAPRTSPKVRVSSLAHPAPRTRLPVRQPSPTRPVPAPRTGPEVRVPSLASPKPAPRTRLPVRQPSPELPTTVPLKLQTIIEDYGSTCPLGYKRLNSTHCQDINECTMQGVCQNGDCLNTQGSFLCACKPGFTLDRTRCSPSPVEQAQCFLMATDAGRCEHALPTRLSQEMCCCTVGKAWGSSCERCPQDGTASFSKICPAGKGYFLHSVRETVAFPPQIHTSLEQEHKQEGEYVTVPPETTTPMQLSTHAPRGPEIITKPTPPPIIRLNPDSDPLEVAQTQVSPETDECRLNRNLCGHGECVNVHTGYKCECYAGYRLHPQRNACVDDDECDAEPCGHGRGICINTEGSYRCRCLHGYKLLVYHGKVRCVDVNECSKPDICGQGGQCVNLPGSYKCDCHKGFRSKSQRQPACEDINECLDPSSCPNEQCENTPGSYECVPCFSGHQAQGGVCYDVNECQKRGVCPNGRCENLPGTYRCLCNEGFLSAADSKGCRDIDECEDDRLCANGRCVNTEGSFQCQCYPGYQRTQEGSHCEDINECERPSNCQRGRCINSMGSYRCECQKGYMLVGGRRCQDIDECATDRGLCQPHGVCENRQGSYVCVCKDGFILSEDKHSCEEIEVDMEDKKECYLNLDDTVFCDSVLATNVTKQECCCSIGVGWGDHCEIYPCPVYHSSEFHSLCPVGRGFYQEEGVTGYGLSVHIDIDECVLFSNEICKEGRCMNTQPGYECYCQQGFYYDSNLLECIDVNECHDESLCTNGQCKNTRGSFYCTCNSPWTPDASSKKCVIPTVAGVDECQDPLNCKRGHCVDTPGSYYCICSPPWILATDRNSCVTLEEQADINECQDPSYCKNGRCVNTPGSFHCICTQPLTFSAALKQCVYDDRTAAHKDVCFLQVDEDLICSHPRNGLVFTYSECCCHYGRGWGPECRTCPQRNSVIFNRLCDMHMETESDGEGDFLAAFANYNPEGDSSEEDSDECSCANGRCVRSYLSTMCDCNTGFRLDHSRTRCTDIDECAEPGVRVNPCKNARCVNSIGSFKCYCKNGFVPARRPNMCVPGTKAQHIRSRAL
uniref:Latent-transforming growth factor beta-binding protein 3 n=1 Tax=Salmo trutta TaxID=8032 RepID=A0A674DP27_SALTR